MKKRRLEILSIIIILTFLVGWFFLLEVSVPFFFSYGDSVNYYLPAYVHNYVSLIQNKSIPLVNFNQYLGQPHLAHAAAGTLYPPTYLSVFLSKLIFQNALHTLEIFSIIHFTASAIFFFCLLRLLKINRTISTLVSLLWITNPYLIITTKAWASRNIQVALLPLAFIGIIKIISGKKTLGIIMLTTANTLLLFGGYVQNVLMIIIMESLFFLLLTYPLIRRSKFKKAFRIITPYLTALLLFVLLSIVLVGPVLYAKNLSALRSQNVPFQQFIRYYTKFSYFASAQIYQWHNKAFWQSNSHAYYIGLFILVLPALLLINHINKKARPYYTHFFLILATIAYLMNTVLYSLLYYVPILNWFRGPHKYFVYFVFFLLLTISGVLQGLIKKHRFTGRQAIYSLLILGLTLNVLVVWKNRYETMDYMRIDSTAPLQIDSLIDKRKGRIFTLYLNQSNNDSHYFYTHNFATLFGKSHFAGYDPLVSETNFDLTFRLRQGGVFNGAFKTETLEKLSSWSVRYLITKTSSQTIQHLAKFPQLKIIYQDKTVTLYENTLSSPYVYESLKPQENIPHQFYTNHIEIFPSNTAAHQITINVAPLPRYVAYADNVKLDIKKEDTSPITVKVPAQTKLLEVKYEDPIFKAGSMIFILTLTSAFLFLLYRSLNKPSENKTSTKQ